MAIMEATLPQHLMDAPARAKGETHQLQVPAVVPKKMFKDSVLGKRGRHVLSSRRKTPLRLMTSGRDGGSAGHDDDDEDEDEHDAGDWRTMGQRQHQGLACPFYKLDAMRHMDCSRLRLSRIRDVKQHLLRRHRQPPYCPVCGDTFDDPRGRDNHIMARACRALSGGVLPNIEGVTETQRVALGRRVDRALDEAGQWFSVWQILFPTVPHPPSPYLSSQFEEVLGMLHESWGRQRDMLIADAVQAATNGCDSDHRRLVTELSCQTIDNFFTMFHTTSRALMDPASPDSTTRDVSSLRNLTDLPPPAPAFPPGQGGPVNLEDGGQTSSNSTILTPNFTTPSFHFSRPVSSPTRVSAALSHNPYSYTLGVYSPPPSSEMQSVELLGTNLSVQEGSSLVDDLDLSFLGDGSLSHYHAALAGSGSGLPLGSWASAHQDTNAVDICVEYSSDVNLV